MERGSNVRSRLLLLLVAAVVGVTVLTAQVLLNDSDSPRSTNDGATTNGLSEPDDVATQSDGAENRNSGEFLRTPEGAAQGSSGPVAPRPAEGEVLTSERLSDVYSECVRSLGIRFEGVDVITNINGEPLYVKTGIDVPAGVHAPCFRRIGGVVEPGASSWNQPLSRGPDR